MDALAIILLLLAWTIPMSIVLIDSWWLSEGKQAGSEAFQSKRMH
ncbi:hypothetical protein BH10CYA1_BH10CYA1_36540 [soil metagenome]